MRTLMIGAGGIGGYFGGRLLEAGRDVTFLVRPARAKRLAATGLVLQSPMGNATLPAPPTILAENLREPFDLIVVSCKAYDLPSAMASFAPAVGPTTTILPLLNGMAHLDALDARFGAERVLGGLCMISSALDAEGRVLHFNTLQGLTFGERSGLRTARSEAIEAEFSGATFDLRHSGAILQELWEKWVFIATMAGITCLMRATLGEIVRAGAGALSLELLDECAGISARQGFPPSDAFLQRTRAMLSDPASPATASLLRDLESGAAVEADQILGDLLSRAEVGAAPLLRAAWGHLKAYEVRRGR